jgi:hypothetical protein
MSEIIKTPRSGSRKPQVQVNLLGEKFRPHVEAFASEMESALRLHDKIKADSWKTIHEGALWNGFEKERDEVLKAISQGDRTATADELVDLANYCAFLWSRLKERKPR